MSASEMRAFVDRKRAKQDEATQKWWNRLITEVCRVAWTQAATSGKNECLLSHKFSSSPPNESPYSYTLSRDEVREVASRLEKLLYMVTHYDHNGDFGLDIKW